MDINGFRKVDPKNIKVVGAKIVIMSLAPKWSKWERNG